MRIIFDGQRGGSPGTSASIMQTFFRGLASDFKQNSVIWSDLVSVLDENCSKQIRVHAEELFLQSMTFPIPAEGNENNEYLAKALLAVIEATSKNLRPATGGGQNISAALVEKLNMLVYYVTPAQGEEGNGGAGSGRKVIAELRNWLVLFLRIIILHRSSFSSSARVGISDQTRLVIGLCALLQVCGIFVSEHDSL